MAGTAIEGKNCKVTIGTTQILGIGDWSYDPGEVEEYDNAEFGDTAELVLPGISKRGSIQFSGLARLDDMTGQEAMKLAKINQTQLTDLRFYMSAAKYLAANSTTGYFNASSTTGNNTQKSYVTIQKFDIKAMKNGLGTVSFSGTVSGQMTENAT